MAKELLKKAIVGILALVQFLTIFVWETARVDTVFDLNFNILHAKVANNSLIICECLGRYLKEFWTILSLLNLLQDVLGGKCEVAWFGLLHAILLVMSLASYIARVAKFRQIRGGDKSLEVIIPF